MKENSGAEQPKRKRRGRRGLTCAVVAVVLFLVLACLAAVGVYAAPYWTGEPLLPFLPTPPPLSFLATPTPTPIPVPVGSEMMLALPSRRGGADLYLAYPGQNPEEEGLLLAEDAQAGGAYAIFTLVEGGRPSNLIGGCPASEAVVMEMPDGGTDPLSVYDYGGFVPGSDRLLLWYKLDDEFVLQQMRIGDEEPVEILESGSVWRLSGSAFNDPELVFVTEGLLGGEDRCYVARPGEEGDRVAQAGECAISLDGATIVSVDWGPFATISLADIDGENEEVVLEEFEGLVSYKISEDASHLAAVQTLDGESRLYMVERDGEMDEVSGPVFRLVDYGFAPGGDTLFYITEEVERNQGVLRLYVTGESDPVAEGLVLSAAFTPDGQSLVYLVEEEGDGALVVHPLDGGRDVEVVSGRGIGYAVVDTAPPRILALAMAGGEAELHSASLDGGDVVELWSGDAIARIDYVPDEPLLYVHVNALGAISLFVTPVDEAAGSVLVEEWSMVRLLNRSPQGDRVVLSGQEDFGDTPVLYSVAVEEGADLEELDDDSERFLNAVFAGDEQSVFYTAITGPAADDREVRQVQADGGEDYEVLFEEAFLIDARWGDVDPFVPLRWNAAATVQYIPETVHLRWFIGLGTGTNVDQVDVAEQVVAEFNASQNLIELELEVVESDVAYDMLQTMIAAGDAPDIVGPVSMAGAGRFHGMWLDLDSYPGAYDRSDFAPAILDGWRSEEEGLIGLPVMIYPSFIYYNRDLFDAAGLEYPPHEYWEAYADGDEWTIEKLEELATLLTLDGRGNNATSPAFDPDDIVQFGFSPQWADLRGSLMLFGGGSFVDEDGDAQVPDHWREALGWYYEGMWERHFIPNGAYQSELDYGNPFNSGRVAMVHCHLWYTCCLWDVTNWDIAAVPAYNGQVTAKLHADMVGILNTTEHPEEAAEALHYLVTSGDLIEAWVGEWSGVLPALESLQPHQIEVIEEQFPDVDWQVALDSLEYADTPNPEGWMPHYDEIGERVNEFRMLYEEMPDLDLDAEIELLLEDLQDILEWPE